MNPQTGSRSAAPFASRRRPISRRRFLRGSAVAMALPFLESMRRAVRAGRRAAARCRGGCSASATTSACCPSRSSPTDAGRDYTPSPYLKLLQEHRDDFTVLSGVSHPNVDGGHPSDICFLTAAPHPASSSFRNTISLDQLVAERIGTLTRFPSLTLAVNGGRGLSWTRTGVAIPPEGQASGVFNQLFLQGTPAEVERAGPRARHRAEHPRRGRRPGQGPPAERRRPRPRPGSTSTSPASATWSTGSRSRAAGRTSRSRRSRPARRSTRPARRSTWPRCRSCTTWRAWPSRPTRPARSR